jgi:hypothetical protein
MICIFTFCIGFIQPLPPPPEQFEDVGRPHWCGGHRSRTENCTENDSWYPCNGPHSAYDYYDRSQWYCMYPEAD